MKTQRNMQYVAVALFLILGVFAPDLLANDFGMGAAVLIGLNTQMTPGQARVVDPILTTHSRGYGNPDVERPGRLLFPRAPVLTRGAKIIKFGRESFRLYNTVRAPGSKKKRVRVGYTSDTINLVQHALAGEVPFENLEEANRVPNINLARSAVNVPLESLERELEHNQATIAQDPNNYAATNKIALAGGAMWSDDASDPGDQSDTAHNAIRSKIGRRGNLMVMGPAVFTRAKRHPKIIAHFYKDAAGGASSVSRAQLADYFGVKQIAVGDDVYLPANAGDNDDFSDVWGNAAVIAYVPSIDGEGNVDVPSYGYTYYLSGNPLVEQAWQDRDSDVWVYPVKDERKPVLTAMDAGYLFTNVL